VMERYSKRSDKSLLILAKLSNVPSKILTIEKKVGLPNKFKVPNIKVKWSLKKN
jgi:hypothetical protein